MCLRCTKESDSFYWGIVTCKINGVEWSGVIRSGWNPHRSRALDIIIDKYNDEGFLRQDFYLFALEPVTGRQNIYRYEFTDDAIHSPSARYFTATDDGDVGCDVYNVAGADSLTNFVNFTEIKTIPRIVAGHFNLRFIIDQLPKCDPHAPDTLWTAGSFVTRY
jgi:hypothetical protein